MLGGVHSDNKIRTDSLNAYNQNIYGPTTYPYAGGRPARYRSSATPCCITFGSIFDDKKRDALTGNLEWRPSDAFRLIADGLWTHLNDPQIGYNESYYFAGESRTARRGRTTRWSRTASSPRCRSNNFQPEMVNNTTEPQGRHLPLRPERAAGSRPTA